MGSMLARFITRYWLSQRECCSLESIFKTSRMSCVFGVRFIRLRLLKMKDTLSCSASVGGTSSPSPSEDRAASSVSILVVFAMESLPWVSAIEEVVGRTIAEVVETVDEGALALMAGAT